VINLSTLEVDLPNSDARLYLPTPASTTALELALMATRFGDLVVAYDGTQRPRTRP